MPIVAGEACTEIGCEIQSTAAISWVDRLFNKAATATGASRGSSWS